MIIRLVFTENKGFVKTNTIYNLTIVWYCKNCLIGGL